MKRLFTKLAMTGLLGILVSPAMAAVQTYSFSGFIDQIFTSVNGGPISYISSSNIPGQVFTDGASISGSFSLDSSTPASSTTTDSSGNFFTFYPSIASLTVKTGNLSYSVVSQITVGNFDGGAQGTLITGSTWTPSVFQTANIWLYNSDGKYTGFTGLPSTINIVDFPYSSVFYAYIDNTTHVQTDFNARLTTLTQIAAVPEPETYAMLAAGLGMMGFIARRRRKSA